MGLMCGVTGVQQGSGACGWGRQLGCVGRQGTFMGGVWCMGNWGVVGVRYIGGGGI